MEHSAERNIAIRRVMAMECAFDDLQELWKTDPVGFYGSTEARETMQRVLDYYESPEWLEDYRRDEQGMFPPELKRGILSEDGFYDFLSEVKSFQDTEKE